MTTFEAVAYRDPNELATHPRRADFFKPFEGQAYQDFKHDVAARGISQPVVVSLRTGQPVVCDGHQRVRAARDINLPSVPVLIHQFDNEEDEVRCLVMNNVMRRQLSRKEVDVVLEHWFDKYLLKEAMERFDERIGRNRGVAKNSVKTKRGKPKPTRKTVD